MIAFSAESANDAWLQLADTIDASGKLQASRDQPTKELLHVMVEIQNPRQRIVFSRPMNPAFAIAETIWMLSGADDLSFLYFWNPRMKKFSDDGSSLCGAYGRRLGIQIPIDDESAKALRRKSSRGNVPDQLLMAYEALLKTPHSRQVTLQIWDSAVDLPNPLPRSKDVPCNVVSHLLVRDNRLEWLQVMRSNDLIWGFPYNIVQFTTLQEVMAGWLGIEVGHYLHLSDSLHVYQRHWEEVARPSRGRIEPTNTADLRTSYRDWIQIMNQLARASLQLTQLTNPSELQSISLDESVPGGYHQMLAVLRAEALRKRGHAPLARQVIHSAGAFWKESWMGWVNHVDGSGSGDIRIPQQIASS